MKGSEPRAPLERSLENGIERRRQRRARWEREGERPLAQNLAMIGALGWLIVGPTIGGIFIGRWIDHREESGITYTAAFLVSGLALGAWLAWQRMHRP